MSALPTGTVTFLFADVEGSTRRLERNPASTGRALARYQELVEAAVQAHAGTVFERVGDGAYAAFDRPSDAALAAVEVHATLAAEPWPDAEPIRARIALDTGEVELRDGGHYFGPPLFRVARLQAVGWGGQTLVSAATARLLRNRLTAPLLIRDLGSHALKDFPEPERVYELTVEDAPVAPPLRSTSANIHLPVAPRPLLGRGRELDELSRLLDAHSLVTITGPGGTGKTRLALALAEALATRFPEGVHFVDFAAVRDPDRVPTTVADELGVHETPPTPLADTLVAELRDRHVLLLLDTFETVSGAARFVDQLASIPGLRIIVTSREPLRLRGEREFPLAPLAVPAQTASLLEIERSPGVQLFVERAQEVVPSFGLNDRTAPVVAEICARLDGLPLAIELAASLSRLLSPAQMLARLEARLDLLAGRARDLPERQRTLRATIAWSYEFLDERQRAAFEGLAVFRDGFTLEGAEAVLDDLGDEIIGVVADLLDKSLLARIDEPTSTRLRMLDTVREYALELLRASPTHERRELALVRWARELVWESGRRVRTVDISSVGDRLRQFDLEHENIVGALSWLDETGRTAELAELAADASAFWLYGQHRLEGRRWIRRAVELVGSTPTSAGRAHLLRNAGSVEATSGNAATALDLLDRSIAAWRAVGDDAGFADALRLRGSILFDRGELDAARLALVEAEALGRAAGDDAIRRQCLVDLGAIAMDQGDRSEGLRLFGELRIAAERAGDRLGVALAQGNDAWGRFLEGDLEAAERGARVALTSLGPRGAPGDVAWMRLTLAYVLVASGDARTARREALEALRLVRDADLTREMASTLDVLAEIDLAVGQTMRAVRFIGAADRIRAGAGYPLKGDDARLAADRVDRARRLLGPSADAALAAARTAAVEPVIEDALAWVPSGESDDP